MAKIDFHLGGPVFMDERVDVQRLGIGIVVHILHKIFKLCDRIDAVGQAGHFATARAPFRGHQFVIGVGVFMHQIELHLGCNNGLQPRLLIQAQHVAQNVAG